MTAVIGITVCIDAGKRFRPGADYLYLRRAYAEAVARAGAIPILLTPETPVEACARLCDGFVISGGGDLPRRFDLATSEAPFAEAEHPQRITWERELLRSADRASKPVLGVCYGMQLINLHHGGSLFRSVPEEVPGALDHGGQGGTAMHRVVREASSVLLERLPLEFDTSSAHGQAIERPAPGFRVTARAADGVVEAIERAPWFGVEWHPESDATADAVYGTFVEMMSARNVAPR